MIPTSCCQVFNDLLQGIQPIQIEVEGVLQREDRVFVVDLFQPLHVCKRVDVRELSVKSIDNRIREGFMHVARLVVFCGELKT